MFNILTTLLTFAYYEHLSRNNITNMFTLELHQIPNTLHKHQLTPANSQKCATTPPLSSGLLLAFIISQRVKRQFTLMCCETY